ncbi:hypothetical protein BKA93DRAFT_747602 [Sparassis latifolia]
MYDIQVGVNPAPSQSLVLWNLYWTNLEKTHTHHSHFDGRFRLPAEKEAPERQPPRRRPAPPSPLVTFIKPNSCCEPGKEQKSARSHIIAHGHTYLAHVSTIYPITGDKERPQNERPHDTSSAISLTAGDLLPSVQSSRQTALTPSPTWAYSSTSSVTDYERSSRESAPTTPAQPPLPPPAISLRILQRANLGQAGAHESTVPLCPRRPEGRIERERPSLAQPPLAAVSALLLPQYVSNFLSVELDASYRTISLRMQQGGCEIKVRIVKEDKNAMKAAPNDNPCDFRIQLQRVFQSHSTGAWFEVCYLALFSKRAKCIKHCTISGEAKFTGVIKPSLSLAGTIHPSRSASQFILRSVLMEKPGAQHDTNEHDAMMNGPGRVRSTKIFGFMTPSPDDPSATGALPGRQSASLLFVPETA